MHFTLDSEEHVKACLRERFPEYMISSKPVIFAGSDLSKLKQENKQFFFGRLTTSDNVTAELTYEGKTVLTVEEGSQAEMDFTQALFKDSAGNQVEPEGLFRGFQITVQTP